MPKRAILRWPNLTIALACALWIAPTSAADSRIDPTQPPIPVAVTKLADAAAARPAIQLRGIWQRRDGRVAMLNSTRVRAGDQLQDLRVVAVDADQVRLRAADGVLQTLRLQPQVRSRSLALLPAAAPELAVRHQ